MWEYAAGRTYVLSTNRDLLAIGLVDDPIDFLDIVRVGQNFVTGYKILWLRVSQRSLEDSASAQDTRAMRLVPTFDELTNLENNHFGKQRR